MQQRKCAPLLHQQNGPAALNLARNLPVHVCRHSSHAARKDLTAFRHKFLEQIGILVIDGFDRNVDAAPRHGAISAAKSGTAFGGFRLHEINASPDAVCAFSKMDCISFSRAG